MNSICPKCGGCFTEHRFENNHWCHDCLSDYTDPPIPIPTIPVGALSTNYRPEITEKYVCDGLDFESFDEAEEHAKALELLAMRFFIAELESEKESIVSSSISEREIMQAQIEELSRTGEPEIQNLRTQCSRLKKRFSALNTEKISLERKLKLTEHHNREGDQRLKEAMEKLEVTEARIASLQAHGFVDPKPAIIELGLDEIMKPGDFLGEEMHRDWIGRKAHDCLEVCAGSKIFRVTPNRLPETA